MSNQLTFSSSSFSVAHPLGVVSGLPPFSCCFPPWRVGLLAPLARMGLLFPLPFMLAIGLVALLLLMRRSRVCKETVGFLVMPWR